MKPVDYPNIGFNELTPNNLDEVLYSDGSNVNLFSEARPKGFKYLKHSEEVFVALADTAHISVVTYLLQNPHTPTSVLQQLIDLELSTTIVKTIQWFDYPHLLGHPNLTSENIFSLMKKPSTREGVAENLGENVSEEIFDSLNDLNEYGITVHLAGNVNTPVRILETYLKHATGKVNSIVKELAGNPTAPVNVLRELAVKNHEGIDDELILNPNTPVDVLVTIWNSKVKNKDINFVEYVSLSADETHPTIGWKAQLYLEHLKHYSKSYITLVTRENLGTLYDKYPKLVTKENYLTVLKDDYPELTTDIPIEWLQHLLYTLPNSIFMVTIEELLNHKVVKK